FFFQAEDGIRDSSVTGVQTCALPIFPRPRQHNFRPDCEAWPDGSSKLCRTAVRRRAAMDAITRLRIPIGNSSTVTRNTDAHDARSEERRVGKECRSWRVRSG